MRWNDLVGLGLTYLKYGIIVATTIFIAGIATVFLRWKRTTAAQTKQKPSDVKQARKVTPSTLICALLPVILFAMLGAYLTIVLGATCFSRIHTEELSDLKPLFYSWKLAWNNFSAIEWRNIALNIAMFVPLGILLPASMKFFRRWFFTYAAGCVFSTCIELYQWKKGLGVFESDDILGNALGTMIGFGLFVIMAGIIGKIAEDQTVIKPGLLLLFQIPLFAVLSAFCIIFAVYYSKELGNLPNSYIQRVRSLEVSCSFVPDTATQDLYVFKTRTYSYSEAKDRATQILAGFNAEVTAEQQKENDSVFLWGNTVDGNTFNITFQCKGGMYRIEDYWFVRTRMKLGTVSVTAGNGADSAGNEPVVSLPPPKLNAEEDTVRDALQRRGIAVPEGGRFVDIGLGFYSFTYGFQPDKASFPVGELALTWYEGDRMEFINYYLLHCEKSDHAFRGISEKEAFDRLCRGEFTWWSETPGNTLSIEVMSVNIAYDLDTKGYYQPVYRFTCTVNGAQSAIDIPALK